MDTRADSNASALACAREVTSIMVNRARTAMATSPPDADLRTIWTALQESGAVLLKGAATTPREFEVVTERFATAFRVHQDPTRRRYSDDDTTQGVNAGREAIGLHAERSYLPGRPELLFFCCLTPPASGGATTVCDGAAVIESLAPDDVRRLEAMTLVWRTTMEPQMWQRQWNTDDPGEAARRLGEAIDSYGDAAHTTHWFDADTLHVAYRAPGVNHGWISGRKAFATYLLLQELEPTGPHATQADGDPVPPDLLRRVAAAADALTIDIPWQRGDLAILDNTRCMHGRRALGGGERQILVRMGDAQPQFRR